MSSVLSRFGKSTLFVLFSLMYSTLIYAFPEVFKVGVVISVVFFLTFYSVFGKNMFIALFSIFILASQFSLPGKYYSFELVSVDRYYYELLPDGIFETFGLVISDVFAFWLLIFFVRKITQMLAQKKRKINQFSLSKNIYLFPFLIYFLFSLYSSLYFSFDSFFSVFTFFQYSKLLISIISVMYILSFGGREKKYFYLLIGSIVIFQCCLGLVQFTSSLPIERLDEKLIFSTSVPEENLFFPRVEGTFYSGNDFAFVLLKLTLLVLPVAFVYRNNLMVKIMALLVLVSLILSQSRTIWMITVLIGIFTFIQIQRKFFMYFQVRLTLRQMLYLLALGIVISLIVVPRVFLTQYFFSTGGGGTLRLTMMKEAIEVITYSPLFGFGTNADRYAMFENFANGYIRTFPFTVHNFYLRMMLQSGLIATIAFFLPFFLIIRKYFLYINQKYFVINWNKFEYLSFSVSVAGLFTALLYYIVQPSNERMDFVFLGLIIGSALYNVKKIEMRFK